MIIHHWNKFLDRWAKFSGMNKALHVISVNAGKGIKLKYAPFWVRCRIKMFHYGMFIFWTKELPLKFKQWRFYRKTGIKLN